MENLALKFETIKYNFDRDNENRNYVNEAAESEFDFIFSRVEENLSEENQGKLKETTVK